MGKETENANIVQVCMINRQSDWKTYKSIDLLVIEIDNWSPFTQFDDITHKYGLKPILVSNLPQHGAQEHKQEKHIELTAGECFKCVKTWKQCYLPVLLIWMDKSSLLAAIESWKEAKSSFRRYNFVQEKCFTVRLCFANTSHKVS